MSKKVKELLIVIFAVVLTISALLWAKNRTKKEPTTTMKINSQIEEQTEKNTNYKQTSDKVKLLKDKYGLVFDLPNENWTFDENYEGDTKKQVYFFVRTRNPLLSSDNTPVYPAIGMIFENIGPDINALTYSKNIMDQGPELEIKKILSEKDGRIFSKNTVGFIGEHTYADGNVHTITNIFIVKDGVGINIILDTFKDVYSQVQQEFSKFIKSVEIISDNNLSNSKATIIRNKVEDKFHVDVSITDKAYIDSWYNTELDSIPMGGNFFKEVKTGQTVYFPITYTNFGVDEDEHPNIYGKITLLNPSGQQILNQDFSVDSSGDKMDPNLFYMVGKLVGYNFKEGAPIGEYTLTVSINDQILGEKKELIKKFNKIN